MGLKVVYTPPPVDVAAMVSAAAELGVEAAGKVLLDASLPDCPVDTGEMKGSGKSEKVGPKTVRVSFTRTGADGYNVAARQHEDMGLNHPGGGRSKWVEIHMYSDAVAILTAAAEPIRAVL